MTKVGLDQARPTSLMLAVRLGEDLHAIPVSAVEEVLPALPIEPVPESPNFLRGVVFVRGHVIPVVSAAQRLGLAGYQRPDEPFIVCLRAGERIVGVEFDEALDLIDVGGDESLSADKWGAGGGFFTGVIDHQGSIIRILDPAKLIDHSEAALLEDLRREPPAFEPPGASD